MMARFLLCSSPSAYRSLRGACPNVVGRPLALHGEVDVFLLRSFTLDPSLGTN